MQRQLTITAVLAAGFFLVHTARSAGAQEICRGDVDNDGVVTTADAEAVLPLLFVEETSIDDETRLRADVNDDGSLSGADVAGILALDGLPCAPPTATPAPTATVTPTTIVSPTPTHTRSPPPTPTPVCEVHQGHFGVANGTLSPSDCQRSFAGGVRLADAYAIAGPPGTAIKIEVAAAPPLVAHLAVIDAAGQFESVEGASPIQFTVMTAQPYQVFVTSDASSPTPLGDYTLTLTSIPCPTPVALTLGSSRATTLDGAECPEPSVPSVGNEREPADLFTFTVTDVPKNVSITMQQLSVSEDIFPSLALIGPEGFELVSQDQNFDCTAPTGDLLCAQIRFLALQGGTYTLLATGSGGTGRYSMTLATPACNPKPLNDIPSDRPLNCPGSSSGCVGALEGNPTHTACAAPLPSPGGTGDAPEPSSPADLYAFTASAGDVISVLMTSTEDAHLWVFGPAPRNLLVAEDDSLASAQLAATLAVPGTYTIVVANDSALLPDDAPVNYTLYVQKCPVRGGLNPAIGRLVSGTYSTLDCLGAGDIPYRTYAFTGSAGQFVTATMTSATVDSFLRLLAPDGSRVENDNDLFAPESSDARVSRILPVDGTYFVEVSAASDGLGVNLAANPPPAFTVRARACQTTAAAPGLVSGAWQDADCDLGGGRKVDIYTSAADATPGAATLSPPSNGCVVALLANGVQTPLNGCSKEAVDIPVLGNAVQGFMVAGEETATRGAYAARFSRCLATTVGYGEVRSGKLDGTNCATADGARADWFLIQAPAGLVRFNFGLAGQLGASFPLAAVLTDRTGAASIAGVFAEDASVMFLFGTNMAALLRVAGATPSDQGTYSLALDPASRRQ